MDGQETKQITVTIAGRPYPLKIRVGDEKSIRKVVREVNEKISRFQLTYTNKDKQDCLAMAVLTYAVDLQKVKQNSQTIQEPEIADKIAQLDTFLDELLD